MSLVMSDSDLEKEIVYLAYRDIFKDKLAKLRKRGKVRRVVEQHKGHLHHKQVADSMDSEKTCRILGDLLAARLFESDSAAKATFPTLFSSGELGNNTAMIVKCVEDSFEDEHEHENETLNDAPSSFPDIFDIFDNTLISNGTSSKNSQAGGQRIDQKSGRIQKPTRITTNQTGPTIHVGGNNTGSEQAVHGDREKGKNVPKPARDWDFIPANSAYLSSKLQHLILTQTQRLLEECCYNFAEKWFPSMLQAKGWDASEAVELTKWRKTLLKCEIPAAATALSDDQSLADLFKCAITIRNYAVHRRPQVPIKRIEEMVRDAHLLAQALKDDLRTAQLLQWHKEVENLIAHLHSITHSQREAAEAELLNIHNEKAAIEKRLVELKARAHQLTQSLGAKGRNSQPIDEEAMQSLEEAFSTSAG